MADAFTATSGVLLSFWIGVWMADDAYLRRACEVCRMREYLVRPLWQRISGP